MTIWFISERTSVRMAFFGMLRIAYIYIWREGGDHEEQMDGRSLEGGKEPSQRARRATTVLWLPYLQLYIRLTKIK